MDYEWQVHGPWQSWEVCIQICSAITRVAGSDLFHESPSFAPSSAQQFQLSKQQFPWGWKNLFKYLGMIGNIVKKIRKISKIFWKMIRSNSRKSAPQCGLTVVSPEKRGFQLPTCLGQKPTLKCVVVDLHWFRILKPYKNILHMGSHGLWFFEIQKVSDETSWTALLRHIHFCSSVLHFTDSQHGFTT